MNGIIHQIQISKTTISAHKININFNYIIETKYQQKKRILKITSERTLQGNLHKKQE